MTEIVFTKNILPPEQFGFRKEYSSTHQVMRLTKDIKKALKNKKSVGVVCFDIEKAFDCVWHDGIVHKLLVNGLPIYLVKLIKSFLHERKFYVEISLSKSPLYSIKAGVPQGSILSPLLYNIYVSDFPALSSCNRSFFADDTCIYSISENCQQIVSNLQNALSTIELYFYSWKIKINPAKTQACFFTKKRKQCNLPQTNLVVCNAPVQWEKNIKYLGVTLDKSLTFSNQVSESIKKAQFLIKILYPLLNRNSYLSIENKLLIYKVVFLPAMLYASPSNTDLSKQNP